ncbi:DUF2922 domain-containing protein [Alkalihalobacterium alkalinitrilicum]|uniref:DUF2922 domain-containing protein n=1 Tax=Alkalihalobacterium alkalinitrilicum TaxID=427920 RepID=UPI000995BB49|nr:DUF2922 domain-containing protein [Alkalihalobacterium alkalinitrilicum]
MTKRLELVFENEQAKTVTISLENPVYPVDPAAIATAMDEIIAQNAFTSAGGNLVEKKSARVVDRTVEVIEF